MSQSDSLRDALRRVVEIMDTTEDEAAIRAVIEEAGIAPGVHVGDPPESFEGEPGEDGRVSARPVGGRHRLQISVPQTPSATSRTHGSNRAWWFYDASQAKAKVGWHDVHSSA
jgi:8-oxo-dGTP pyrophosphatase MutT (NUDIX family)